MIFGQGDNARAVISTVIVHCRENTETQRVQFVGPVAFDDSVIHHIDDILLPIIDNIVTSLSLDRRNYTISVVNPGAASTSDLGVKIAGFSADVPLLLALLSASLDLPIPEDLVTTGHIASSDGDIAAVKSLPAKLDAAGSDTSIRCFIYPALDRDVSLETLSPAEKERASDAIIAAKCKLRGIAVGDIAELCQAVLTDEAMVLAFLRQGFFDVNEPEGGNKSPIAKTLCLLTENNECRFWDVLERNFLAGNCEAAKSLLSARAQFHIQRKTYPNSLGLKLLQLVRSLPPTTRRLKTDFPLISMDNCISLSQFAGEADHDDVRLLYDASFGKNVTLPPATSSAKVHNEKTKGENANSDLENVLAQIDSESLARNIALPIDTARASYLLDSVTTESHEQFYDTISAFYLHLLRHTEHVIEPSNMNASRAGAIDLVERTFAGNGGLDAALAEARDAIHGGMRFILDALTEQFKTEIQVNHINQVLKEALNPLDWEAKVAFMSAFLKRIEPFVSAEIRSIPPERLARNYETIVKTYVESFDKVKALLRTL